jgi:hypothetical protein
MNLSIFSLNFLPVFISNIIFLSIAYGVNEDNADLLISGYNTMSKEKKMNFNLLKFLIFFKKFFINLTLYSSLIFCGVYYLFNVKYAAVVYTTSLVLAFIYFIIISNGNRFKKKKI